MKFLKADNMNYDCLFLTFYILPMWLSLAFWIFLTKAICMLVFQFIEKFFSWYPKSLQSCLCDLSCMLLKQNKT